MVDVDERYIRVEIIDKSACAMCRAKELCAASEESIRTIDIPLTSQVLLDGYQVGEKVRVVLASSLGARAVILAYGVPLVVLLASLLASSACGLAELYAALCAIGAVALYYAALYLFRGSLDRVFLFSLEKLN